MNAELDEPADMRARFDYVSQLTEEFGVCDIKVASNAEPPVSGRVLRLLVLQDWICLILYWLNSKPMRRGSLSERYVKFSKPRCPCATDTNARHGPYFSLTRAVKRPHSVTSDSPGTCRGGPMPN